MLLLTRSIRCALPLCALLLAAALCDVATSALAQPSDSAASSDPERNQARSLANSGYQMFQAKRYDEALAHFQAAEKIFHAPTLVIMIARTQVERGKLADAAAAYQQLVDEQLPADAPPEFTAAQQEARQEFAELRTRVPSVQLRLRERRDIYFVKLRIDGAPIEPSRLTGPISVNPGRHTLEITVEGSAPEARTIDFSEGQFEMIELDLPDAPGAAPPDEQGGDEAGGEAGSLAPAISLFAVGGAGLLVGIITGAVALGKESELEELCPDKSCFPEQEPAATDLADEATAMATVSTVGFIIAGLGTAAGVTLLLLRDTGEGPADTVALVARPNGLVLRGAF